MKVLEYNQGHSFLLTGITYGRLCRYLSQIPGLVFTKKPRFFWRMEDVCAEFIFREIKFKIEGDPWEGGLWVEVTDDQKHPVEMGQIKSHIQEHKGFLRWFCN